MHYTYHYKLPDELRTYLKTLIGQPLTGISVIFGRNGGIMVSAQESRVYADCCYLTTYSSKNNKRINPLSITFEALPWGILGETARMNMQLSIQKDALEWIDQQLHPQQKRVGIGGKIEIIQEIRLYSLQSQGKGDPDIDENFANDTYEANMDTMLIFVMANSSLWRFSRIHTNEICDGIEVGYYHNKADFEQEIPNAQTIFGESIYQLVEVL